MTSQQKVPYDAFAIRWRFPYLFALFMLVVTVPFVPASATQNGSDYETELLGWIIEVSGPNYVLENVALEEYPHGRGERVYITSLESAGFAEVSFFDDEDTPEQTIELMLRDFESASQSLEVLDSGYANAMHYAFARFTLEQGLSGYFYVEVAEDISGNTDLVQSIYTLDADFLEQVAIARSEISLDGLQFFADPVIDLETLVVEDQALLASTPEAVPTPDQGSYTYRTVDAELVVEGSIEFDFPLFNRELDVMFLSSNHGYGVVGFIHQDVESPQEVMDDVFLGVPPGEEAPVELHLETDEARTLGVYRVETQGEIRAMLIQLVSTGEGLWRVEAMAVTESEFASELAEYQSGVLFDGEPLLGDINADDIVEILDENE